MEEILKTIIENLVDNKDAISIEKVEGDFKDVYKIKVEQSEMGKIIGKQGKIAQAIRKLQNHLEQKTKRELM